jgi:hypothetical protein
MGLGFGGVGVAHPCFLTRLFVARYRAGRGRCEAIAPCDGRWVWRVVAVDVLRFRVRLDWFTAA